MTIDKDALAEALKWWDETGGGHGPQRDIILDAGRAYLDILNAVDAGEVAVVPVDPTDAMDDAARDMCHEMRGVIDPVCHVWDEMISAAGRHRLVGGE